MFGLVVLLFTFLSSFAMASDNCPTGTNLVCHYDNLFAYCFNTKDKKVTAGQRSLYPGHPLEVQEFTGDLPGDMSVTARDLEVDSTVGIYHFQIKPVERKNISAQNDEGGIRVAQYYKAHVTFKASVAQNQTEEDLNCHLPQK